MGDSVCVSVVMAAHNAASTIEDAMYSVLHQSLDDLELIVVDDCSTDETLKIAQRISRVDARVRVVQTNRNLGCGGARSTAIGMARGTYLAMADADDISLPRRLELQARAMSAGDVSLMSGQVAEFGSWGGPEVKFRETTEATIKNALRQGKNPVAGFAVMFSKQDVLAVGGYDQFCLRAEDVAMMRSLYYKKFVILDAVIVLYRVDRPIEFDYVIQSGRSGLLAIKRTPMGQGRTVGNTQLSRPTRIYCDFRSSLSWLRRRVSERPQKL